MFESGCLCGYARRGGLMLRYVLAVLGFCLVLGRPGAEARDLNEELRGLLDYNPQIEEARQRLRAAGEAVDESFAGFLPSVDLFGEAGYQSADTQDRRDARQGAFEDDQNTVRATLTQKVFDAGATQNLTDAARAREDAADKVLDGTQQNLLFRGASAYLNVLRQHRLRDLARINQETIREQLDLENERVRRGSGLKVSVLQAKARLQLAKEERVAIERRFRTAVARYTQVFGHAPNLAGMSEPEPIKEKLPRSEDAALAAARQMSPQLAQAQAQARAAAEQRDAARSGFFPTVDFVVEGLRSENEAGDPGVDREARALVRLNWNLFNGFATSSAVERASHEHSAAMERVHNVSRTIDEQVRVAWSDLEQSREQARLLANAVNIAAEVFEARKRLRAAGKETALNVLDAERELNDARIRHLSAQFDARIAAYQVLLATGQLTPERLDL